jgi:hypothetical protein
MLKKCGMFIIILGLLAGCSSKEHESQNKDSKKKEKTEQVAKTTAIPSDKETAEQLTSDFENDIITCINNITASQDDYKIGVITDPQTKHIQVDTTSLQNSLDEINQAINYYAKMPYYYDETKHEESRELLKGVMNELSSARQGMTDFLADQTNQEAFTSMDTRMTTMNEKLIQMDEKFAVEQGESVTITDDNTTTDSSPYTEEELQSDPTAPSDNPADYDSNGEYVPADGPTDNPADYDADGEYKPVEDMTQEEIQQELEDMLGN